MFVAKTKKMQCTVTSSLTCANDSVSRNEMKEMIKKHSEFKQLQKIHEQYLKQLDTFFKICLQRDGVSKHVSRSLLADLLNNHAALTKKSVSFV